METRDLERNKALDNLEAGRSVSLWADRETGALFILACVGDTATFKRRQQEGAFVRGVDFVCEVTEAGIVAEVRRWNVDAEVRK